MSDSHLSDDEVDALIAKAVKAETVRCAKLVEMRAAITRNSAAKERRTGTYTTLFGHTKIIDYYAKRARVLDEVAHSFDVVALCIRAGYDTEKPIDRDDDWGNVGTEAGSC